MEGGRIEVGQWASGPRTLRLPLCSCHFCTPKIPQLCFVSASPTLLHPVPILTLGMMSVRFSATASATADCSCSSCLWMAAKCAACMRASVQSVLKLPGCGGQKRLRHQLKVSKWAILYSPQVQVNSGKPQQHHTPQPQVAHRPPIMNSL